MSGDGSSTKVTMSGGYDARSYDAKFSSLIPDLEQLNKITQIVFSALVRNMNPECVIDLGVGTGRLIDDLFTVGFEGLATGVDFDQEMLDLSGHKYQSNSNVRFVCADFLNDDSWVNRDRVDMVISGLTMHHFNKDSKKVIYERIFSSLRRGGGFVNQDLYSASTSLLSRAIFDEEIEFMRANNATESWIKHYLSHRHLNSISSEFALLESIGFRSVDCVYRSLQSGLLVAYKD